jgi:hypothetical protein
VQVSAPEGDTHRSNVAYPVTGWVDGSPYQLRDEDELIESFWIHVTDCRGNPRFVDSEGRDVLIELRPIAVAAE